MPTDVALGGAVVVWGAIRRSMQGEGSTAVLEEAAAEPEPRQPSNAVLVFGGTGKLGRLVVQKARSPPSFLTPVVEVHSW